MYLQGHHVCYAKAPQFARRMIPYVPAKAHIHRLFSRIKKECITSTIQYISQCNMSQTCIRYHSVAQGHEPKL